MPNKIDDFVPYRLWLYIMTRLEGIAEAEGYNNNVFVTDDVVAYQESVAKHTVLVEVEPSSPQLHGVGGDPIVQEQLGFVIVGVSKFETEHPRRLAFSLEQDVRTAIHSDVANIRASVGRGCSFRFTGCQHDGGFLAPDKEVGFRLTCSFTWSQRSDW